MREIVHIQAGQCGNQIGAKVSENYWLHESKVTRKVIFSDLERRDEKNFAGTEEKNKKTIDEFHRTRRCVRVMAEKVFSKKCFSKFRFKLGFCRGYSCEIC